MHAGAMLYDDSQSPFGCADLQARVGEECRSLIASTVRFILPDEISHRHRLEDVQCFSRRSIYQNDRTASLVCIMTAG